MEKRISKEKGAMVVRPAPRRAGSSVKKPLFGAAAEHEKQPLNGFQTPPPKPEFSPKAIKEYGTYLRELREMRGLSIQKVSQDTKIIADVLRGMEEMNRDKFPSDIHLVGLIKLYAKYLGANPDEVLEIFRSNRVSETQVNFEIINISRGAKKRVRSIFIIIGIAILVAAALTVAAIVLYPAFKGFFVQRAEARRLRDESAVVARINSIYENTFSLRDAVLLAKNNIEARATIASVSPPVIAVGDRRYPLQEGAPVMIDLGQGVQYAVVLRSVDLARRELLLRFDPRASNPSVSPNGVSADIAGGGMPDATAIDGSIISLLAAEAPQAIQFTIAPKAQNADRYFRYEADGQAAVEGALTGVVSGNAQNYVDIYVSNAAAVTLTVNGVAVAALSQNLPTVLRIMWRDSGGRSELVGIPLS